MQPYAENSVTFRVLLGGYAGALQRFNDARLTTNTAKMFFGVFEALNWAVALDDQAAQRSPRASNLPGKSWWQTWPPSGRYVQAVRHARNRVHHQWADALIQTEGMMLPTPLPAAFHEWRWRPSADLPASSQRDPRGQASYDDLLAGQPARVALEELRVLYEQQADLLEPSPPTGRTTN